MLSIFCLCAEIWKVGPESRQMWVSKEQYVEGDVRV